MGLGTSEMTELLRDPWLGRTIVQELGEVLEEWSQGEANNRGVTQTRKLSFEDDESCLRVRSPCPRVVQIIKVWLVVCADLIFAHLPWSSSSYTKTNRMVPYKHVFRIAWTV